jgi:hypothetical protein
MGNDSKLHRTPEGCQSLQLGLVLEPEPQSMVARIPNRAPLARSSDARTSHIAAENFTRSGRRGAQKRALLSWLRGRTTAMTSAEIAVAAEMDRYAVARRLPDLERDGLVERCAIRQCTAMGTLAITWRATR